QLDHGQPKLAPPLPDLAAAERMHSLSDLRRGLKRIEALAGHGGAQRRPAVGVLQDDEHEPPAVVSPQLGDLALDPDRGQALQIPGDALVEAGNRENTAIAVTDRYRLAFRVTFRHNLIMASLIAYVRVS